MVMHEEEKRLMRCCFTGHRPENLTCRRILSVTSSNVQSNLQLAKEKDFCMRNGPGN